MPSENSNKMSDDCSSTATINTLVGGHRSEGKEQTSDEDSSITHCCLDASLCPDVTEGYELYCYVCRGCSVVK